MKNKIAIALVVVFLAGLAVIIYQGRPAQQMAQTPTGESPAGANDTGASYTIAEVESHAVQEDCWSVVNGSVYDLTSWVSRHPGGAGPIISMCGKDSTAAFERMHGGSATAQAALMLLKIGRLN